MKVLVADPISQRGIDELSAGSGLEVRVQTGLGESELVQAIPEFHALVVRSQTKVTAPILQAATRLRVIGRAGVGVDNVDVETATRRGVIVMNTPGGRFFCRRNQGRVIGQSEIIIGAEVDDAPAVRDWDFSVLRTGDNALGFIKALRLDVFEGGIDLIGNFRKHGANVAQAVQGNRRLPAL